MINGEERALRRPGLRDAVLDGSAGCPGKINTDSIRKFNFDTHDTIPFLGNFQGSMPLI